MAKYYAVKKGRQIGIYNTWEECNEQVKGYSDAKYKRFSTYNEALAFIEGTNCFKDDNNAKDIEKLRENEMIAYIDGSFDVKNRCYSFGAVIITTEGKETHSKKEMDNNYVEMRNVAGEIRGAIFAIDEAIKKGKDILYIYHDYTGIEKWATGEWQAKKPGTKSYREYYDAIKHKLKIVFIKVKSHSGDKYNDEADLLAKDALGL